MKKFTLLFLVIFLSGCSLNKVIVRSATGFMEDGISVLYREDDLGIAEHYLANNLKMIEILLVKDPNNTRLNIIASQGFGAYAMSFVEDTDPNRASKLYLRGVKYGLKALPKKKKFSINTPPKELENILKKYNTDDIAALFWTGYNWGLYIMQNLDQTANLVNLAKTEMIMKRCLELGQSYYYYSVDLFFGAYYAGRPKILGGNPEKGKGFFLHNIEQNKDKIILGKLFYARYYAIQTFNEELFDNLIEEILTFDIEKNPDYKLLNAVCQKKAKLLKQNKNTYF